MNQNKKTAMLSGLFFGIAMGCYYAFGSGLLHGLVMGLVSGVVFGLFIYFFYRSKTVNSQKEIELESGEPVIHKGVANHFLNGESVGGKLFLLKDKIWFKSHKFNFQNHELQIAVDHINNVSLYNIAGVVPNGLSIKTTEGKNEKFVVNNRDQWMAEILKVKGSS
jgi:hypothetical protein